MTLIYGMSAANVESYAENFYEDQRSGDMVIWYSGLSRSVNCMMLLLAVAAALLPTLLRTEEYKGRSHIDSDCYFWMECRLAVLSGKYSLQDSRWDIGAYDKTIPANGRDRN